MARPKKKIRELRAIRVNVRMTVDEYLILSQNASTLGITIPDYIRKRVTGKTLPRKRILLEDRQLFIELGRIGNNINQLTKKVHLGMKHPPMLINQLAELKNILDMLKSNIVKSDCQAD
ncbi:MAG: plasmid mobilization relaxosome protein MobC [Allomuricauda sp.]|jgi:phage-related holin|nr:MAG: plasmid mobilization relaxosome protein MobC [Muricauda sp. TMED12]|tara:strand:+ start:17265 stop:17621 length:357 start_codon:yes stop_codon:yes gene_type:complete